jgi:hypothetical protein
MSVHDKVPVSITEQRLRDAFAVAAQTVTPATIRLPRPDEGPAHRCRRGPARLRNRQRSWERSWGRRWRLPRLCEQVLIPLTAAVAVAAIATLLSMVMPRVFSAVPHGHAAAARLPGGHVVRSTDMAAGYAGRRLPHGATPRYFVGIRQLPEATAVTATSLAVYSAITGRQVATVAQPARGRYYRAVATLGSDKTFVVAAIPTRDTDCHTWFYRFSLGPQGRPTAAQPLSVPEVPGQIADSSQLATSANGGVLAYSASMCQTSIADEVGVIRLGTGKITTWSGVSVVSPRNLSLSADGTLLSFVGNEVSSSGTGTVSSGTGSVSGSGTATEYGDAVWTLATNSPAGPVTSHYRRTLYFGEGVQTAELSPTGMVLFAMPSGALPWVNAYDTATGKLIGVVRSVARGSAAPSLSADTSGQYLLVSRIHVRFVQELNLVTRQLRTIPMARASSPVAVAW